LGQVIFAIGISIKSWPVIFIGRLVFGFGGESFTVANSALLAEWFKGKELALAFGINLSISKLGSVINNILSPILADKISIVFAMWFGAMLCGFGIVCVLLVFPIDKHLDDLLEKQQRYIDATETTALEGPVSEGVIHWENDPKDPNAPDFLPEAPQASFKDVFTLKHIFWVLVVSCVVVYGCVLPFNNISSSLLQERDYFILPPSGCQLTDIHQCEDSTTNPPIHCPGSQWYQPPLPYNYSTYSPLTSEDIDCTDDEWKDGCTSEYCSRLSKAETQASFIMSIPYIISAALSPPVGFLVDMYGFRAVIATIAPAILIIVHMMLAASDVSAIGPLVGQGLAYTGFVSVLWPSVPLVVEERVTGLAFGIVTSMQNLACAIIPLIVAAIYTDSDSKYIPNVEYLFVSLACIGVVVGFYLNYYDFHHGGVLNAPYQVNKYDPLGKEEELDSNEGGGGSLINPLINDERVSDQMSKSSHQSSSQQSSSTSSHPRKASRHSKEGRTSVEGTRDSAGEEEETFYDKTRTTSHEMRHRQSRTSRNSRNSRGGSFSAYDEVQKALRPRNKK
jgi:MFS family permease